MKKKATEDTAQTQALLQAMKEANAKLFEEKKSRQSLAAELDKSLASYNKLQLQVQLLTREKEQLTVAIKLADKQQGGHVVLAAPSANPRLEEHAHRRVPKAPTYRKESTVVAIPRNTADVPKPVSKTPFAAAIVPAVVIPKNPFKSSRGMVPAKRGSFTDVPPDVISHSHRGGSGSSVGVPRVSLTTPRSMESKSVASTKSKKIVL